MSCAYVLRPIKFTTFIDESVGKNKSIASIHGSYTFLLEIVRKGLFEQKYRYVL